MSKAWNDDDFIIAAYLCDEGCDISDPHYTPHGAGVHAQCELCDKLVACLPETLKKTREPNWHLICIGCQQTVINRGDTLRFMGRFTTSEGARKALEQ